MFRTKEKLTAILVAIVTFAATLLLGFATLLGMPQKVSSAKAATSSYVKVTEAPTDWSGTYLIVYEAGKLAFNGGLTTLDAAKNTISVTISNNEIEATNTTKAAAFTITKSGTSYTIKSASGYYIGQTSNANGLKSNQTTTYANTITLNSDDSVNLVSSSAYLRFNKGTSDMRFRYYRSGTYSSQQAICLYKLTESSSSEPECKHENASEEETTPATCTTAGEKTYTCTCGKTWTEEIPATGHKNTEIRHIDGTDTHAKYCTKCDMKVGETVACSGSAATSNNDETTHTVTCGDCGHQFSQKCTWEGETTLTCTVCGATKETALCTITFSVFGNTDVIEAKQQYINKTIELPDTLDNLPMGATFVGWTTNENATTADGVRTGNYTVKEDETLYALISYVRYENANAYKKVTEAPADWSGKYLIVYEDNNTAYIFNGQDAVKGYVSATIQDGVIASTAEIEAVVATIESITDGYSILVNNKYVGRTATSNGINLSDDEMLNTISLDNGNAVIKGEGGTYLRFNNASDQMRFRYYGSGQKAIQLYALTTVQVPVTAYTTTLTAKFNSASLTIGTDLTMNYYATVDGAYTDLKAQFTIAGDVIEVDGEYDTKTGRYVFSLALPPQCMADNISAVLLSGETEIAWVNNYSVRTYAINTLNKTTSNELKALLYELLRYGAAAQQYTSYNTGDLATAGVTLPEAADVNATDAYSLTNHIENGTADDYPVYINAVGVRFENVNKIYVKFNATAENVSVRISRGGVEVETIALTNTILYTNEIYATAFDEVFTFEVFVGETKTQTLTYSVNSYVANRAAAGSTDAMTDLAKALYLYGEAAKAYAPFAN